MTASPACVRIPWRSLIMVGALVVIWIVFTLTTDGTFLRPRNLSLLARQTSVTAILAVGMVLVIVAGQIDLSVGALAGLMGGLAAISYMNRQWPLGRRVPGRAHRGIAAGRGPGLPRRLAEDPALHRDARGACSSSRARCSASRAA